MAFSELEAKRNEKVIAQFVARRRPPPHLRAEVDMSFRLKGQSIEIFELRPQWQNPSKILEHAIAKATYNKTKQNWKVYWQRADLRWHRYDPVPEVSSLEEFIAVVEQDEYCCFFG